MPPAIATARKTLDWAAERLSPEGSFAEAEDRVSAYYLAPLAFALGGRPDLAQLIAEYARAKFFCRGDINARVARQIRRLQYFATRFSDSAASDWGPWIWPWPSLNGSLASNIHV